jgi:hypothetical protein
MLTSGDARADSPVVAAPRAPAEQREGTSAQAVRPPPIDGAIGRLAALAVSRARPTELGSRLARIVLAGIPAAHAACVLAEPPLGGSAARTPGDEVRLAWRLAESRFERRISEGPPGAEPLRRPTLTGTELAERCGYGSVLTEPLVMGGVNLGAIAAFAESAGAFGDDTRRAARLLAPAVAARLADAMALLAWHLGDDEAAGAVERAAGVLMAKHRISAGAAAVRLRRAARRSGRELVEVAADLLQTVERAGGRREPLA